MELNYIREFVVLSQSCQFQKTADDLYISQSSLSKHIRAIEKELGQDLLKRSTRRVELTDFGKAFLPYATQIAALQEEYSQKLLRNSNSFHIRLGFIPVVTLYTVNRFLGSFSKKHPEYTFEIEEGEEEDLRNRLSKGELDFIILCSDQDITSDEFYVLPYRNDTLIVIASSTLTIARKKYAKATDLMDYSLIQKGHTNFAHMLDSSIPPAAYSVSRSSIMMSLIVEGAGISVLPYYVGKSYMKSNQVSGVELIPIEPEKKIYYSMLCKKTKENSLFLRSLADFLSKDKK